MKHFNHILLGKSFLLLLLAFGLEGSAFSQDMRDLVASKHFTLQVQSTSPQSGITKQESFGFFLKISGDTLISYLPYYGRAITPNMNPGERPLDFTTTNFEFDVKERKKGGWDISIKPVDQKSVREMTLTIFDNGTASLHLNSNNLDPISYSGIVTAVRSN